MNYAQRLRQREQGLLSGPPALWDANLARRLQVEALLQGHTGCVNRLAWNESGTSLASISDDTKVLIWGYDRCPSQPPLCVATQHTSNGFGVAFLPHSNDLQIATGAMDRTVQLHTLDPAGGSPKRESNPPLHRFRRARSSEAPVVDVVAARTTVYQCHRGRVKHVETAPGEPYLFFSASEDGTVRQFDSRMDLRGGPHQVHNVLAAVRHPRMGVVEVKALALSQARPWEMALACGDPFIRIYDRRRCGPAALRDAEAALPPPVLALAPPHLQLAGALRQSRGGMHATHVAFSRRGDRVLGTFHSDAAYAFDVRGEGSAAGGVAFGLGRGCRGGEGEGLDGFSARRVRVDLGAGTEGGEASASPPAADSAPPPPPTPLPPQAEDAKAKGNEAFFSRRFAEAVRQYSRALSLAPDVPALRNNRAAALLMRDWPGDAMWALADTEEAVRLDPRYHRAHFRRIKALRRLEQWFSVGVACDQFAAEFPSVREFDADFEKIRGECRDRLREMRERLAVQRADRQGRRRGAVGGDVNATAAAAAAAAADVGPSPASGPSAGGAAAAVAVSAASPGSDAHPRASSAPSASFGAMAGSRAAREILREGDGEGEALEGQREAGASGVEAEASEEGLGELEGPPPPPDREAAEILFVEGEEEDDEDGDGEETGSSSSSDRGFDPLEDDIDLEGAGVGVGGEGAKVSGEEGLRLMEGLEDATGGRIQPPEEGNPVGTGAEGSAAAAAPSVPRVSSWRYLWESSEGGRRLSGRFCGQSNVQTDIKECRFMGPRDELVCCGSDCGRVFIYDAGTGNPLRVLQADEDVANCCLPHPWLPVLATSGIENVIRLWSPTERPEELGIAETDPLTLDGIRARNMDRSREGPHGRGLNARILQVLAEQPALYSELLRRAAQAGAGAGAGATRAHGDTRRAGVPHGGEGEEEEGEEGGEPRVVSCRPQ